MADEAVIVDNDAALADAVWNDKPTAVVAPTIVTPLVEEKKPEDAVIVEEKKPESGEDIFDANDYVKSRFGFDTEELAVEGLRLLREKAETPAQIKFANEKSEEYYRSVAEGNEDEVYRILHEKKQLERAEKLDLTKASDAAEVLRLALHYKHPDLSLEEIQDEFQEKYTKPGEPQQSELQTNEDYDAQVSQWKQQCEAIDKRIIREAKMVKPELAKYKNELILPKIEKAANVTVPPSQEDLAKAEQDKQQFFKEVDKGLSALKGYNATYKSKDVEIPVSYDVTLEDKAKIKPIVESLFTDMSYFAKRWQNKDGSWNTTLMAEDVYNLENRGNIHQKFVNDAAGKMWDYTIKTKKNLNVTGESNPTKIEPKDQQQKFEEAVWS